MLKKIIYCHGTIFSACIYAGSNNEDDTKALKNLKFNLAIQLFEFNKNGHYDILKFKNNDTNAERAYKDITITENWCMTLLTAIEGNNHTKVGLKESIKAITSAFDSNPKETAKAFLKLTGLKDEEINSLFTANDDTRRFYNVYFKFCNANNWQQLPTQKFDDVLKAGQTTKTKIGLQIYLAYIYTNQDPHIDEISDQGNVSKGCCRSCKNRQ